jgi:hypothetical protein
MAASVLLPSAAFAVDPRPYNIDGRTAFLTLNQETPLNSWDSLAPQTVRVIGVINQMDVWIDTWIGPAKIRFNDQTMKQIGPDESLIGKTLEVKEGAPLYDDNTDTIGSAWYKKNGLALAAQSVKVLSVLGNYAKINTWVGEKFIDVRDFQ